jgi:hypothetical protein
MWNVVWSRDYGDRDYWRKIQCRFCYEDPRSQNWNYIVSLEGGVMLCIVVEVVGTGARE